jgi:hypothetical protein
LMYECLRAKYPIFRTLSVPVKSALYVIAYFLCGAGAAPLWSLLAEKPDCLV